MVIGMTAQLAFRQVHGLQRQGRQTLLHGCLTRQHPHQLGALAVDIGQGIEQVQHAATFRQQRFACGMMSTDRIKHRVVTRQRKVMQFGVATR